MVRANSNFLSLHVNNTLDRYKRIRQMLILVSAVSPSATTAGRHGPLTVSASNSSDFYRLMKNPQELFDVIKARPKFISHQRNRITH